MNIHYEYLNITCIMDIVLIIIIIIIIIHNLCSYSLKYSL